MTGFFLAGQEMPEGSRDYSQVCVCVHMYTVGLNVVAAVKKKKQRCHRCYFYVESGGSFPEFLLRCLCHPVHKMRCFVLIQQKWSLVKAMEMPYIQLFANFDHLVFKWPKA